MMLQCMFWRQVKVTLQRTRLSHHHRHPMAFKSRNPDKKVLSIEQSEGVGARVRRSIGRPELRSFDPFLMLVCSRDD